MPTFREFFGFQFASQTIVEIYVAKKPGANQFTGIPDAFFEKKYWNVLFEVDGNKVISTMPTVLADQPAARTAPGKEDIVAETEYNPAAGRYVPKSDGGEQSSNDYGYDSAVSESNGYGDADDDYGQGASDYGHDSESYGQDSDGYGYDSNGYEYDSEGYGQTSDGYEYESGGSEYGSVSYGNDWDRSAADQFSRRTSVPDAFRRKANQTPANAYRREQNYVSRPSSSRTRRRGAGSSVNRMGTAAAANRAVPARSKQRTSSNSKRMPPQSSRRPVPYGPKAVAPTRSGQSPAGSRRRTQSSHAANSNRRASSAARRGAAPARSPQPARQRGRRPAAPSPPAAPTPPGWQPPLATNYRSQWPEALAADYEDNELRREAHRNQLKYKAKHGYMRRMSPERYTAWQRTRHR